MDWTSLVGMGLDLAQKGVTYASATAAQRQALDALAKAQQQIAQARGDFEAVGTPTYKSIDPRSTQLGDTELKGIQGDPQGRVAEQQAYAELKKLADNGGLSLGDMKALNDIQGNLNRNATARDKSLQNSYAARGQLGGGAQLAMELAQGQQAGERANQQGESVAAQAQARALQAIKEKAGLGRQMSQDDYEKKAAAAKAADLIKQRNMDNSIGSQKYNNEILGQGFDDRFNIARGKTGLLPSGLDNAYRTGFENSKQTVANGAFASGLIGDVGRGLKGAGGSGSDIPPGGGAPDYQDPSASAQAYANPNGVTQDPSEWAQFGGQHASESPYVEDYDPSRLQEDDE